MSKENKTFVIGVTYEHADWYMVQANSEEEAILRWCFDKVKNAELVVTYNGHTFDIARLGARIADYGLMPPRSGHGTLAELLGKKHLDLGSENSLDL